MKKFLPILFVFAVGGVGALLGTTSFSSVAQAGPTLEERVARQEALTSVLMQYLGALQEVGELPTGTEVEKRLKKKKAK